MRNKVIVTISKTISVVIDENCLTKEALDEFEELFFPLDEKDTREESLMSYAAACLARYENDFIEGIGQAVQTFVYASDLERYKDCTVFYDIQDDYSLTEIEN
jgi:hypothetical protein